MRIAQATLPELFLLKVLLLADSVVVKQLLLDKDTHANRYQTRILRGDVKKTLVSGGNTTKVGGGGGGV